MNRRWGGLLLAVAVLLVLAGLTVACVKQPEALVSVAGVTNLDSLSLRDNLVVGKATSLGSGGLSDTGNFTMSNGSILNTKGGVTVTDQLVVTSQITGLNGVNVTGGVSLTTDLVMHGGNIWDDSNDIDFLDDVEVSNNLTVDAQLIVVNGISAAGGITSTDNVTVTAWGMFYGVILQPAASQVVTASYGITPTDYSLMYLADNGSQATGTITLDTNTSIVSGTLQGQLLVVFWMDSHGATLTIKDGGNVQGPANADVVLGYQDSAMFVWDLLSSDWLCINVTDL